MKYLLLAALYVVTPALHAEEVFRIEVGRDYKKYSDSDLKRRVWELERAVWQLQQRVFQLEAGCAGGNADSWVCTITAMGNTFTGTGGSKAAATHKAVEACKDPKCEQ